MSTIEVILLVLVVILATVIVTARAVIAEAKLAHYHRTLLLIILGLASIAVVVLLTALYGGWLGFALSVVLLVLANQLLPRWLSMKRNPLGQPFFSWTLQAARILRPVLKTLGFVAVGPERGGGAQVIEPEPAAVTDIAPESIAAVAVSFDRFKAVKLNDVPSPELLNELHQNDLPFVLVYQGAHSNVVGVINKNDLLRHARRLGTLGDMVDRRLYYVHEHESLANTISLLIEANQQIALVLGEHNSVQGAVLLRDILERMIGELPPVQISNYTKKY